MFSDNTSSNSPIFEMIRELSFRDDFGDEVKQRTLIILSDMMQHTPEYSHYKSTPDFNSFSQGPYADEVKISLNSIDIKIVYFLRDKLKGAQGKRHLSFWKEYFEEMGTEVVEVRNIR